MNYLLKKLFLVFCISMLPVIELRGAIPVGVGWGIPFWANYVVCVVGNILPVPILILFSKKVLIWLSAFEGFGQFFKKIILKADEKANKIGKIELLGLFLFVAVPLPGTGAWTGSLIAAILRLRLVPAFFCIAAGVATSGIIMGVLSFGLFGLLSAI